jgi:hypothetical protein
VLGAVRTITLNPTPQAAHAGGISYSGWLVGSVVPMWLLSRAAFASWRVAWRLGKRRRQARADLSHAVA